MDLHVSFAFNLMTCLALITVFEGQKDGDFSIHKFIPKSVS